MIEKLDILKEITLLYVEDDEKTRELYAENLERRVKALYTAKDGQEGLEKYEELSPDIIITDIQMPVMTGIEMTKKIREKDENIPIIVTTAFNTIELLSESLELDISGYLVKPINNKQLINKLSNRAKLVIAKKEEAKRNKTLQAIINADNHLLVVTDLEQTLFMNNTFMKYFNVENCEEFNEKYNSLVDMFMEQDGFLHKGLLIDDEDFMELLLRTDTVNRNVMIFDFNSFSPKSFNINITPIDRAGNKDIYLISLMDISQMTIEKAKLQSKVYYDNLTNIYNRNKVDEVFDLEIANAKRYGDTFSMILIDIDHFKSFNDTYGHLIGDEVLVMLAKTIQKVTRATDIFARWGGEEFVVILPKTTKENATIVAEHLRQTVEKINHPTAGSITSSFGVSQYEENDTEESIYTKCDEALYEAKATGRNKVCVN